MFCKKCGKVVDDNSSFCKYCGASLLEGAQPQPVQPMYYQPQPVQPMYYQPQPGQPMYQQPQPGQPMYQQPVYRPAYPGGYYNTASFDMKLLWFIGVGISVLFASLGLFVKLYKINLFGLFDDYAMKLSVIDIWKEFGELDGDGAVAIMILLMICVTICFAISIIMALKMLIGLAKKIPIRYIADEGKDASIAAIIGEVFLFINMLIENYQMDAWGDEGMLKPTFFFWAILVLSLLNVFLFAPNARWAKASESPAGSPSYSDRSSSYESKKIVEKRCNVCRTVFIIGTSCPKCGSRFFDIDK